MSQVVTDEKIMQLEKMHVLQIKISLEIKRICEKHNISYFIMAGTVLGAVRHGGFIPWDDDMDIGMLREEYNKFLKVCETELGEEFFLQTWDTDPEFPFSYAKVRLKSTNVIAKFAKDNSLKCNGIFVDLFPFDNAPDDAKLAQKQAKRYFVCKRLLWLKKGMGKSIKQESFKQKLKYYASYFVASVIPYNWIKNYFQKVLIKYNDIDTRCVVADSVYTYQKESLDRKWVTNLENVKFETEEFMAFKDRIAYLEHLYGDYMKLPDEDKRYGHEIEAVDFGPYESI